MTAKEAVTPRAAGARRAGYIGLLRGINVGGHNRVPMAELRALCGQIGWTDVRSYVASGNLVFAADGAPADLETELEEAIERRFGLTVPVIVRPAAAWSGYAEGNPFPDASETEPQLVALVLSKAPPSEDAVERLRERAADGERVERVGDALWVHYRGGTARSKLSPDAMGRAAGSPVTARNWRTVSKLAGMVRDTFEQEPT